MDDHWRICLLTTATRRVTAAGLAHRPIAHIDRGSTYTSHEFGTAPSTRPGPT